MMMRDGKRNELVIGKTKEELTRRFGYLLSPKDATPYRRTCFEGSDWRKDEAMFIRNSDWMVVFANGRASNLILVKGC